MQHFKYINTIRKPDGTLRNWQQYDDLTFFEANLGYITYHGCIDTVWPRDKGKIKQLKRAIEIIDNEE